MGRPQSAMHRYSVCPRAATSAQIDLLLEHTNRDYLNLCLDTAHTTLCGMNPAKLFDKYLEMGVVKYIHMKDINGDPDSYPEYPPRR